MNGRQVISARWRAFAAIGTVACSGALVAGCSGGGSGGGSDAPATTVSFLLSGSTVAESATSNPITVVLHTTESALPADVTVDVGVTTGGSAIAGSDYSTFTTQTITFPAGSVDGDAQSVTVTAIDDHLVEGTTDTVRLALSNVSGASIAGTSIHTVSISDVHAATIQFQSGASATPNEASASRGITVVLDLPSGVSLGTAATARVVDLGGGSAAAGVDYASFPTTIVSFPASTADGATQTVNVSVLDDASSEGGETVRLGLTLPGSGTSLAGNTQHVLTITDDDAAGSSAFAATSGPTGTDTALAYDATLAFGTQGVSAGATTGTLVRVTNSGGASLSLDAPRITGTDANDFSVDIESSSTPAAIGALDPALAPAVDVASALVPAPTLAGPGVAVVLDAQQLAAVRDLPHARWQGFPVPGLGEVALDLHAVPLPIAADAVLRVDGVDQAGGLAAAVGDLSLWSGSVEGLPGSRAFLAVTADGPRGFLDLGYAQDRIVHVVPDAFVAGAPVTSRVMRESELNAMGVGAPPDLCGGEVDVPGAQPLVVSSALDAIPNVSATLTVPDVRLAIETDWQLYQKFNSTVGLTNYVTQLIAAVSDQYFRDVQTTMSIAYLGIYTSASDPWSSQDSGGDASALLSEFRTAWTTSGWPASANLAHFVSGASLGGGVAYVGVLCNSSYGFGVSGNINGLVNWGSWTGAPGSLTWDFVVVAHEIGHNFGSSHTHSFCPPLDQCSTNCNGTVVCTRGTIMSYCHTCGGMSNIDLQFHPVCANVMRANVNSSCLSASGLGADDWIQYRVRFDPLTTTGAKSAFLEFTHGATNVTNPFRVQLQGTAN